jgi:hypothetical protein
METRDRAMQYLSSLSSQKLWEVIDDFIFKILSSTRMDALNRISNNVRTSDLVPEGVLNIHQVGPFIRDYLYQFDVDSRLKFFFSIPLFKNIIPTASEIDPKQISMLVSIMNVDSCRDIFSVSMIASIIEYGVGNVAKARGYWSRISTQLLPCAIDVASAVKQDREKIQGESPIPLLVEIIWLVIQYQLYNVSNLIDILYIIARSKIEYIDVWLLIQKVAQIAVERLPEFKGMKVEDVESRFLKFVAYVCESIGGTERRYDFKPYVLASRTILGIKPCNQCTIFLPGEIQKEC